MSDPLDKFFDGKCQINVTGGGFEEPFHIKLKRDRNPDDLPTLIPGEWAVDQGERVIYIGNDGGTPVPHKLVALDRTAEGGLTTLIRERLEEIKDGASSETARERDLLKGAVILIDEQLSLLNVHQARIRYLEALLKTKGIVTTWREE